MIVYFLYNLGILFWLNFPKILRYFPKILSKISLFYYSFYFKSIFPNIVWREPLEILSSENSYYMLGRDIGDICEDSFKNDKEDLVGSYREYNLYSLESFSKFSRKDLLRKLAEISKPRNRRELFIYGHILEKITIFLSISPSSSTIK